MFVFNQAKNVTCFELFCFASSSFVRVRRNYLSNLAFRTTVVEDPHLTLAVIPFKVEANNSLNLLLLETYEKTFANFPFLFSRWTYRQKSEVLPSVHNKPQL